MMLSMCYVWNTNKKTVDKKGNYVHVEHTNLHKLLVLMSMINWALYPYSHHMQFKLDTF